MLSHERIWGALDALAERHKLSASGLARRSGLDPTSFNKSKRQANDGRLRWPSTESISKVLQATDTSLGEFLVLVEGEDAATLLQNGASAQHAAAIPLLGFARAGADGFFDDKGFPTGQGWEMVDFPTSPTNKPGVYALEVEGDLMLPLYRDGDTLIVEPGAEVRRGDRVVVRTRAGEVMAMMLFRQTSKSIELGSFNAEHPNRTFVLEEIAWVARIIWASQ